MTDSDDRLAKRYRELSREMPPPALDREILAASQRAVATSSRSGRWAAPVSIAAVLVLAFGVTLQMQREEPQVATSAPAAPAPAPTPAATEAVPVARDANVAAPPPRAQALKKEVAPPKARAEARRTPEPRSAADAVAPAPAAAPAAAAPAAPVAAPAAGANAMQSFAREKTVAPPERELERIARLRADGRHEEADKALEVFRREHPDYRIAEAMWERVKPR